jgi:hypothetical protein
LPRLWEQGIPREGEDGCWVGEAMVLRVTTPCTPSKLIMQHIKVIECSSYYELQIYILHSYVPTHNSRT